MHGLRQPLLAVEKQPQESRFQEEAEDSLHGQRLADHAAREPRKARPVGAELELHGDAGDHAENEIDGEDAAPEACGAVPVVVAGAQRHGLKRHNQQAQPHGELRKKVVKGDGEGKMKAMNQFGAQ